MKSFFIVVTYSIASFISDNLSGWLFIIEKNTTGYTVQNAFTILEYSLFTYLVFIELQNKTIKKIIILLSALFYFICIYNYISTTPHFDSMSVTVESILIISYCIYFFFEQINIPRVTFIYSSHQFWIISGILIYLAATFFLFMQADSLSKEVRRGFWIIAILSQIIRNLFFLIALLTQNHKDKPQKKFDNHRIYTEF